MGANDRPDEAAEPAIAALRELQKPVFRAFTIKVTRGDEESKLRRAATAVLGEGWKWENYGDGRGNFEVYKGEGALPVDDAWRFSRLLRKQPGVKSAQPVFKSWVMYRPEWGVHPPGEDGQPQIAAALASGGFNLIDALLSLLCGNGQDFPEAHPHNWSLRETSVETAWHNFFGGHETEAGTGVVVGHPDTGYRRHPEIKGNLLVDRGFDFVENDADAMDRLHGGGLNTPGHGTGTSSVIASPTAAPSQISGVAPGAKVIPFRAQESVVILDGLNLGRAIDRAVERDVDVISMSMGGVFDDRVRDAVERAWRRGIIVLAAAGNCVRIVVWPAAYEKVVAVAASDARRGIWFGSSRGLAVDITAPGDRVWHALANADDNLNNVNQGSGTSYAVATVAGIAALWLARWGGRKKLIDKYKRPEKVPTLFMQLLRQSAVKVPAWGQGEFGAGLADANALLSLQLPADVVVPAATPFFAAGGDEAAAAAGTAKRAATDSGELATFAHLFEGAMRQAGDGTGGPIAAAAAAAPRASLQDRLAALLNTTPDKVNYHLKRRKLGRELAFHLVTDPELYRRFEEAISTQAAAAPMMAAGGAAPAEAQTQVAAVRDGLLAKGVSPELAQRLIAR